MKQFKLVKFFFFTVIFLSVFQNTFAEIINDPAKEEAILNGPNGINVYRSSRGFSDLTMNSTVRAQARIHNYNLITNAIPFDHVGFSQRIANISGSFGRTVYGAENIAWNTISAEYAITQWINSAGHRQNIEGNYTATGIAVHYNTENRRYYVTQIFVKCLPETIPCPTS